jgi:excisionase family DNA binding protein
MSHDLPLAHASQRLRGKPGRPRRGDNPGDKPQPPRQVPDRPRPLVHPRGPQDGPTAGRGEPRLLGREQAASYLGVGVDTVDRLRMRGELQPVGLCGLRRVLYDRADLDGLIERSRG